MRLAPPFALCFAAVAFASSATAQCPAWLPGPLDMGTAANGTDGAVYAAILWDPDGAGPLPPALVIGGAFTMVEGVPALHVAMRNPATGQWQALGAGTSMIVNALTVWNGELIVGGDGDFIQSTYDNTILGWDGTSWHGFAGGTNLGSVRSLAVFNGDLYAGGNFQITAPGAKVVARWDAASDLWRPVAGLPNTDFLSANALTVWNSGLVAGLSYPAGNTYPAGGDVFTYNGSSWTFIAAPDGGVSALQPFNGELAFGGSFVNVTTTAGTTVFHAVAAWDGASIQPLGTGIDGPVDALGAFAGRLYAGGNFSAFESGLLAANLGAYDGSAWQACGGGTGGVVAALCPTATDLVVGGSFTAADGSTANQLARWNGFAWAPFGGGNAAMVSAITAYAGRIVVGGAFHQSADPAVPAHEVAGFDGNALSSFGIGMDGPVNALRSYAFGQFANRTNELVAGGSFTHAGGVVVNDIARWDQGSLVAGTPAWQAMGAGFDGGVYALERATVNGATNTYAGGTFLHSGGGEVTRVARWNPGTSLWEDLGGGMNGTVYALRVFNGSLYAGGAFTTAGGVSTGGLARWDGTGWNAVGGVFGGVVHALEVFNGELVIGGAFGGLNLTEWNGTTFANFGTSGADGEVDALHVFDSRLYVGGQFAHVGGVAASDLAYWDGAWHAAAGGVDNAVEVIGDFGGELQVGGALLDAGAPPVPAVRWARGNVAGRAWFVTQPQSQTVSPGTNVTFTAQLASGYGTGERWYRNGAPLADGPTGTGSTVSGSTGPVLTVGNVSHTDFGDYQAILTTLCGPDTSTIGTLTLSGTTGVTAPGLTASIFESIGPNPNHGPATIAFTLAHAADVQVRILDLAGRQVGRFAFGRLGAGHHQLAWDARDADGRGMRPGMCFVLLLVDGTPLGSRRLTFVR